MFKACLFSPLQPFLCLLEIPFAVCLRLSLETRNFLCKKKKKISQIHNQPLNMSPTIISFLNCICSEEWDALCKHCLINAKPVWAECINSKADAVLSSLQWAVHFPDYHNFASSLVYCQTIIFACIKCCALLCGFFCKMFYCMSFWGHYIVHTFHFQTFETWI